MKKHLGLLLKILFLKNKNKNNKFYLDFSQNYETVQKNRKNWKKKKSNVLQLYLQLKILQEHFHIGQYILRGDVS